MNPKESLHAGYYVSAQGILMTDDHHPVLGLWTKEKSDSALEYYLLNTDGPGPVHSVVLLEVPPMEEEKKHSRPTPRDSFYYRFDESTQDESPTNATPEEDDDSAVIA